MRIYEQINLALDKGELQLINKRNDHNISVTDGTRNYGCDILEDDIFDAETNELLFKVTRHIGIENSSDYFTYDILDYKKGYHIESSYNGMK